MLPSITTEILKSVVVSDRAAARSVVPEREKWAVGGLGVRPVVIALLPSLLPPHRPDRPSGLPHPRHQARFDAGELITQRELVSRQVSDDLTERAATFGLILDDVSLVRWLRGEGLPFSFRRLAPFPGGRGKVLPSMCPGRRPENVETS